MKRLQNQRGQRQVADFLGLKVSEHLAKPVQTRLYMFDLVSDMIELTGRWPGYWLESWRMPEIGPVPAFPG